MTIATISIFFLSWLSLIATARPIAWLIFYYDVLRIDAKKKFHPIVITIFFGLAFLTVMTLQYFEVFYGLQFVFTH
jgi:hypothetical protein